MTAPIEGHPVRNFETYHNENGTEIQVAEVQEAGDVVTYGGQSLRVRAGDLISPTARPDEFVVLSNLDGWNKGEAGVNDKPEEDEEAPTQFDPNHATVAQVNEYVDNPAVSEEERARVLSAERAGRNRVGVLER